MTKTRKPRKPRKPRKTRKILKYSKKLAGNPDPYLLKGTKICGERFDLYFNEIFASSNYYVYSLCKDKELNDCNEIIAKVYEMSRYGKKQKEIDEEVKYMVNASKYGVSPEFLGIEYCTYNEIQYAILIMQKYGNGNLTHLQGLPYYKANEVSIKVQLKQILDTLYNNKINQGDLHSDNFLYRMTENEGIEFKIIDFDKASHFPSSKQRNYIIENLYKTLDDKNGDPIDVDVGPIDVE